MLRKSKYIVLFFLCLALSTINLGSNTDELYYFNNRSDSDFNNFQNRFNNLLAEFDHYVQQSVDNKFSPGAAIAVVYRGSIVLLKGYGVKEAGKNEKIDAHTVFRLGSVSKGFASVLSGLLVNQGYFSWDDPVITFMPEFNIQDTSFIDRLTIRHILSHTSGFPVHAYTDLLDAGVPFEKIKESLSEISIYYPPGKVYAYQNVIYSLIGDVMKQVSDKTYNELIRENIFSPLKMTDASVDYLSMLHNNNTAIPHLKAKSGWKPIPLNDRYYSAAPASGINASASDMAQWLLAVTGNYPEIIPLQTLKNVTEINIRTPLLYNYRGMWKGLQKTYYGLGWRIFSFSDRNIIYHGGYVEGYRAEIAFDPVTDLGIVALFNANTSFASSCIPRFYDMFLECEKDCQQK